ncbi:MAG: type II secretion system protein GspJ [Myxococcota bacterium]|nr:type II secretion system protein GspJ [Myxococcota bacterium]
MNVQRHGFTLVEVMVSLGIMMFMATIAWSTMAGTIEMRDYLEEQDQVDRSARVALNRLTHELSLAFLTDSTSAVNTYRTLFVGQDDDPADQLWFTSLSHRRMYRGTRESDQTEITLWTDEDPKHPGRMVLLHREAPRIDHEPDQDGTILPLATSVTRFDLRYLDGETGEWLDDWDTAGIETPDRLPRAVQILLTIMGPAPDDDESDVEHTYLTTVLLETADALEKSAFARGQQ